ncbi:MAG: hypothetical protein ABW133_14415 [Polyangiaceae bacterium]
MQLARFFIPLTCAGFLAACGTEVAVAGYAAPQFAGGAGAAGAGGSGGAPDSGTPGIPDNPPPCMGKTIRQRLQYSSITLPEGVRYKRANSYFFGFPQDDRIVLAASPTDGGMVAWLNAAGTQIHVSTLTQALTRPVPDVPDYVVEGTELSGLVVHDDGFAVLTRRPDLGDPLGANGTQTPATVLVRYQFGRGEVFAVPLTGTKSITNSLDVDKRDHPLVTPASIALSGRLVHNGTHYGAYFSVRGGPGDRFADSNGDKFVQVDDSGQFVSGWRNACRQNLGGRLVAEPNGFVAFCMSDGLVGDPGMNAVPIGRSTIKYLVSEATTMNGYVGGNFGSVVKVPSGYLVAWASRGVEVSNPSNAAHSGHEPATGIITKDLAIPNAPIWPFNRAEPKQDTVNVHAVPIPSSDKVLLVWETIDAPTYRSPGVGSGTYGGTHFRLVDGQGKAASDEEPILEAIAPNGPDDIVQFPNGDVGWAYVREAERNFQNPVTAANVPQLPPVTSIQFVRLPHCLPP